MYEERSYNFNGLNCAPKFEPIVHFGYQIYMTIALLIVPLVAMTVLYGNVIYTLSSGIRMDIAAISGTESSSNATPLMNSNDSCLEKRKNFRNGTEISRDRASRVQRTQTSAAGTPRDEFHSCLSDTNNHSNASGIHSDGPGKMEEGLRNKNENIF
uniref:Uncharacterized protein n=1 Tax=Meloidogyne javanica TaxID=6303 RepID=A0A915NDJ8_MELJA